VLSAARRERTAPLQIARVRRAGTDWLLHRSAAVALDDVIVCTSGWDREAAAVLQDMEGVAMLITGRPEQESDGGDADGEIGDGAVLSPRITASKYETFNVPEDGRVPMYHHHHDSQVMHISLNFKTRTTTYEYLGHSVSRIDQ